MSDQKGLGAGLSALIPQKRVEPPATVPTPMASLAPAASLGILEVPITAVVPNPYQPRDHFDEMALEELVSSIKRYGILEPLVVTKRPDGMHELIAGERRFRAAKALGLRVVPVMLRGDGGEEEKLELALVENIQRRDLDPIERAKAYERLIREFRITQEEVARRVGKSRESVANTLRLLSLPEPIKLLLREGKLTEGHAKVLLATKEPSLQLALAQEIVNQQISVSGLLRLRKEQAPGDKGLMLSPADQEALENSLSKSLGTKVTLTLNREGGEVHIRFFSQEELRALIEKLDKEARQ